MAISAVFGLVALIVDRRALLVSALAYVLVALAFRFWRFGMIDVNWALTALLIGSAPLVLLLPGEVSARLPTAQPT